MVQKYFVNQSLSIFSSCFLQAKTYCYFSRIFYVRKDL